MKVESKSISYHAFSLSFSLSLFWDKEKESNQPALGINLPLRLPHMPGEQIREVKMIPRSMWRQFANSSSARDKEKESKRWAFGKIEETNRPTPLPRACLPCRRNKQRRMQTAQSNQPSRRSLISNQGTLIFLAQNFKPDRDQSCGKSTRSSISKTRFAFLNSTLSGFYFAIFVMFIR
ncbi:hypothetical protein ACFX2K_025783 [Malus domestica]